MCTIISYARACQTIKGNFKHWAVPKYCMGTTEQKKAVSSIANFHWVSIDFSIFEPEQTIRNFKK